jgi:hypothetical protein
MPEAYFHVPGHIIRRESSLSSGANNPAEELTLIDLGNKPFVLQAASVAVLEDDPQETLLVSMVVKSKNPDSPPGPPTIMNSLHIPMVLSGHLKANGSGNFVGSVQGPIPIKAGETLSFQVQRKIGPGTFSLHVRVWGYSPGK